MSTSNDQSWANIKRKRSSQLERMLVDDLKSLCRDTGLKVSGKKAEVRCNESRSDAISKNISTKRIMCEDKNLNIRK